MRYGARLPGRLLFLQRERRRALFSGVLVNCVSPSVLAAEQSLFPKGRHPNLGII